MFITLEVSICSTNSRVSKYFLTLKLSDRAVNMVFVNNSFYGHIYKECQTVNTEASFLPEQHSRGTATL